jgi:hypothetical protein
MLANVEALAGNEWNNWTDWFSQGLTKDEREEKRDCPSEQSSNWGISGGYNGVTVGISGSSSQTNPPSRKETICPAGNVNCTPVGC